MNWIAGTEGIYLPDEGGIWFESLQEFRQWRAAYKRRKKLNEEALNLEEAKMADHRAQTRSQRDDPWAGRNQGMRCHTCVFFVEKAPTQTERPGKKIGRCRRHAPTMKGFPIVFTDDWCGEHRLDENKVAHDEQKQAEIGAETPQGRRFQPGDVVRLKIGRPEVVGKIGRVKGVLYGYSRAKLSKESVGYDLQREEGVVTVYIEGGGLEYCEEGELEKLNFSEDARR